MCKFILIYEIMVIKLKIIMERVIGAHGHDIDVIDGLNTRYKGI